MRQAIDGALLSVIGWVNVAVFSASRHRVILYHFRGRPDMSLTIASPAARVSETADVGYLTDGDDYIVLAAGAGAGPAAGVGFLAALRTATVATADFGNQQIPGDVTALTDETERAVLLRRMLKHASVDERHDVTRRREVPIARLRLHHAPTSGSWVGITRS